MRVLLISDNPFPQSIATVRHLALQLSGSNVVDGLNLFPLISSYGPSIKWRDVFYERATKKYEKFIKPALNGLDLTNELLSYTRAEIPPLPKTIEELRQSEAFGAKIGLA